MFLSRRVDSLVTLAKVFTRDGEVMGKKERRVDYVIERERTREKKERWEREREQVGNSQRCVVLDVLFPGFDSVFPRVLAHQTFM